MDSKLKELLSYIKEKRNILDQIKKDIGLESKESTDRKKELVQCKYNSNHYVPSEFMSKHTTVCPYMAMGMTRQETEIFLDNFGSNSAKTPGHSITINPPTSLAIHEYIDIKRREKESVATSHITQGPLPSLESSDVNNDVLQSGDPILLIRHEVSGTSHIVDIIIHQLNLTPTVTPDLLVNRLQPFLFSAGRGLVLSLWKFLSILKIQQKHNISDTSVNELVPLLSDQSNDTTSLVCQIETLAASRQPTTTHHHPLPMEYVQNSVEGKRILYDYCIELGKEEIGEEGDDYLNDKSLFRDDARLLSDQAKERIQEEEKSHLEQLKEKRDIRRRRQSYRAKNVHITQKSIKQMFHEIIAARTEELMMAAKWESFDSDNDKRAESGDKGDLSSMNDANNYDNIERERRSISREERRRSRSREGRRCSRSREERRRSKSRERRRRSSSSERSRKSRRKRSRSPDASHDRSKRRDDRNEREHSRKSKHSHKHKKKKDNH